MPSPATQHPSATQLSALQRMAASDGTIRRLPGGFWVSGTPTFKPDGTPKVPDGLTINDVWCDVRSVRAMEARGWVERANAFPDEWRDTRRLTAAGRALLS